MHVVYKVWSCANHATTSCIHTQWIRAELDGRALFWEFSAMIFCCFGPAYTVNAYQALWLASLVFHTKHGRGFGSGLLWHASLFFKLSVCIFTYLIYKHIIWNDWVCVISRLKAIKTLMLVLLKKEKMKIQRTLICKLVNLSPYVFLLRHERM